MIKISLHSDSVVKITKIIITKTIAAAETTTKIKYF